jgi:hypothetical protein
MDGVVPAEVGEVLQIAEVVDAGDAKTIVVPELLEDAAADTSESVDADANGLHGPSFTEKAFFKHLAFTARHGEHALTPNAGVSAVPGSR